MELTEMRERHEATDVREDRVLTQEVFVPSYSSSESIVTDNIRVSYHTKDMYGQDIPNFHERVANGELLPHTHFQTFVQDYECQQLSGGTTITNEQSNGTVIAQDIYSGYMGHVGATMLLLSELDLASHLDADLGSRLVQGVAAKVYNKGFDVSTFVAESRDIQRSFTGLVRKAILIKKTVIKKLAGKALSKGSPKKLYKFLEEAYLEGRYGWRPLYHDIINFYEVYNDFQERRTRWSDRVGTTQRWTDTSDSASYLDPNGYFGSRIYTVSDEWEVSHRGALTVDVGLDKWRTNPLQTGWEVIPYSFVVDWFFSVGQAIAADALLLLADSYSASWGCKITRTRVITGRTEHDDQSSWPRFFGKPEWSFRADCKAVFSRRTPCSVPINPQVAINLDGLKVVDLWGLLNQAFGESRNRWYG